MEAVTVDRWGRCEKGILAAAMRALGATVLPGAGDDPIVEATAYVADDESIVVGPSASDEGFTLVLWQLPKNEGGWVPVYTGAEVLAYSQDAVLARLDWNDYLIVQSRQDERVQLLLDPLLTIWKRVI